MRPRRVLVVDDDHIQRRVYCRQLCKQGFQAVSAVSGIDGLNQIKEFHPDLVLADIRMGFTDGIQMLKIMRQSADMISIPVILMTGMPVPESMLQAAADGLHAGPIVVKGDSRILIERINAVLGHAQPPDIGSIEGHHILRRRQVSLDLLRREVFVSEIRVPRIASKRFDLLVALFRRDFPVSQEDLLTDVWGHAHDLKVVQMTVGRLRDDLKNFPAIQIRTDAHRYELVIASTSPTASR